jgi:hypothetical protein
MTEPCNCPGPGFCDRHGFHKTIELFTLCQNREDYRKIWDEKHSVSAQKKEEKTTLLNIKKKNK